MAPREALGWAGWFAALAGLTAGMVAVRAQLDEAHVALAYLLLVLAASVRGSRGRGLSLAVASFFCFNFFFLPPFHTLSVEDPLNWLVLFSFLAVAGAATHLAHVARRRATEAERAEALREADRLKDALIASVSHDLRTPLTTIKALAHELREGGDERAVIIEEEADRLNRFVADLLDLSLLNAGELRVQPEVAAAEDLVGAALQRVSGSLGDREIRARIDAGDPIPLARFDFVHSLRVLVNLLENAHRYAPPATPLDLVVVRRGERLAIEVADRGPGIPPTDACAVFAPFYRARDSGGAGLGLSIARRLADAQGGSLDYAPREGGGSVFTLSLPAVDLGSHRDTEAQR